MYKSKGFCNCSDKVQFSLAQIAILSVFPKRGLISTKSCPFLFFKFITTSCNGFRLQRLVLAPTVTTIFAKFKTFSGTSILELQILMARKWAKNGSVWNWDSVLTSIFSMIFPMREGAHESFPGGAINQIQSTYTVSNIFLLFECTTSWGYPSAGRWTGQSR